MSYSFTHTYREEIISPLIELPFGYLDTDILNGLCYAQRVLSSLKRNSPYLHKPKHEPRFLKGITSCSIQQIFQVCNHNTSQIFFFLILKTFLKHSKFSKHLLRSLYKLNRKETISKSSLKRNSNADKEKFKISPFSNTHFFFFLYIFF